MAFKIKFPPLGVSRPRIVHISGTITIGSAGAISSSASEASSVVKTASKTGRYTVTLDRAYKNLRIGNLDIQGPTDVALTGTDGNNLFVRNVTGQTFDIQAYQTSFADANPASGTVIYWEVWAQE